MVDLNKLNKKGYRWLMAKIGYPVMREAVQFGAPRSLLKRKKIIQAGEAIMSVILHRMNYCSASSKDGLFFCLSRNPLLCEAIEKTDDFTEILPYYRRKNDKQRPVGW